MPGCLSRPPYPAASLRVLVVASGIIVGLTAGLRQVTGLYLPPVTVALGIGTEPFSTALAVANLAWGASSVAAGAVADKFGTARVAAVGVILMGLGYLVLYAATSGPDLLWSGALIGIGTGSCGVTVMVGAVGRAAAADRRTAAIAALGISNGIGNFVVFPYTHLFIETLGWRGSILALVATLGTILPLALLLRGGDSRTGPQARPQGFVEAMAEALRLPSYRLLMAGFFVCGFHVAFYAAHLPAYAATLGLETWVGVTALTAVGAANILGTYLAGQSARYVPQRFGLSAIYAARSIVFLGFVVLPIDGPILILLSTLLGLFWLATVPLTSGLVATFFGTAWLSSLFGLVFFAHQVGAFLGVWLAGVLFDAAKSYEAIWWIAIALGLVAAALHWPIREAAAPRIEEAKA